METQESIGFRDIAENPDLSSEDVADMLQISARYAYHLTRDVERIRQAFQQTEPPDFDRAA